MLIENDRPRTYNFNCAHRLALKVNLMNQETFQLIDQLKAELDSYRPLPASVVSELEKNYTVRYTYNSNAIEGNTLTQRETEMVLEKGITVGGKTLVEHLAVYWSQRCDSIH